MRIDPSGLLTTPDKQSPSSTTLSQDISSVQAPQTAPSMPQMVSQPQQVQQMQQPQAAVPQMPAAQALQINKLVPPKATAALDYSSVSTDLDKFLAARKQQAAQEVQQNASSAPAVYNAPVDGNVSQRFPGVANGVAAAQGAVTTPFGGSTNYEKFHPGIDIANKPGTPISSPVAGTVIAEVTGKKQGDKGYGNYVIVQDAYGNKHRFSHLRDEWVKVGDPIKAGQQIGGMGNCFDDQTEILTEYGWRFFEDLSVEDLVVTGDLLSMEIVLQKPTAYIKKIYPEMLDYGAKSDGLNFSVSFDHRMLYKLHQDQAIKVLPVSQIPNRVYVPNSAFSWVGEERTEYRIPECRVSGGGRLNRHGKCKEVLQGEKTVAMDAWLAFLGFWLSDGCLVDTERGPKRVIITQSFNNPEKRKTIETTLEALPFKFSRGEDYVSGFRQLFMELRPFGRKGAKRIPDFIFKLSPRQISIFIDAFMVGDGWKHKGTQYVIFGEKSLADQFQHLLLLSGHKGVCREYDPRSTKRTLPAMIGEQEVHAKKLYWVITVLRWTHEQIEKKRLKKRPYGRFAYCVSVPNGIIYVRREGKPMWCGNSGSTYSTSGGTGTHLDYRIQDAYGKYMDPSIFLGKTK